MLGGWRFQRGIPSTLYYVSEMPEERGGGTRQSPICRRGVKRLGEWVLPSRESQCLLEA